MATTVTSKGQVTIPKEIRVLLGIEPGHAVDFRMDEDGRVVIVKAADPRFALRVEKWRGKAGAGPSTDDIMAMTRGEP